MNVCSFEALARWRHSELGWISPSEFIPITEQISVVEQISEALLTRAAAEAVRWPDSIRLSFNLSAVQLCSDGSAQRILHLIAEAGLDPSRLQLEVTETALLGDFDAARRNLSQLGRAGVRLVLDDFGAGYASISYLREMKFDAVKLDGSLVAAATVDRAGMQLLKGVLDLCRAVGLPCVAEHVETEHQVAALRLLGCQYGQGYWLARPMPAEDAQRVAEAEVIEVVPVAAPRRGVAQVG
jgi:EAL domain-containing protein (putative c-di-GMP-specific phosphodiesterase class I)